MSVLQRVSAAFPTCASLTLEEDVNTLIYAANCPADSPTWRRENLTQVWRDMDVKIHAVWPDTNVEVADLMQAVTMPDV